MSIGPSRETQSLTGSLSEGASRWSHRHALSPSASGGNAGECSITSGVLLNLGSDGIIEKNHLKPKLYEMKPSRQSTGEINGFHLMMVIHEN
jgi:hypothetical protein